MVDRTHKELSDEDINTIADIFEKYRHGSSEEVKGFYSIKDLNSIKAQNYILTPGRYIDIKQESLDDEVFDEEMTKLTSKLSGLLDESDKLDKKIKESLKSIGYDL